MATFLGGIKSTLKLDEVAGGVASKFNSAKTFLQNQQHAVAELAPIKSVREKVGNLWPNGVGQFGHYLSPATWTKYFPAAKGSRQSPIDLVSAYAQHDETLGDGKFRFTYNAADCIELRNTGASWQILAKEDAQSIITAAHLPGSYKLKQIHCHWGSEATNGSEHCVEGIGYAAELHMVHYNVKYGTIEEAIKHQDGLAVLGIFLRESDEDNSDLEPLIRIVSKLRFKGDVISLPDGFNPICLIPTCRDYWTYDGSLTTPPCTECVVWTVFKTSIPISRRQLDAFRQLYAVSCEDCERNPQRLINNVRPPQALNNRPLRASFR